MDSIMAWACLSQNQQRKSTAAASAFPARTERSGLLFTNDVEGTGFQTAETIRKTVESETVLTVSIGVSFSKIFAKLGSDMKKPNAVTVIPRTEYKEKVWPLPVSDLLYVGPATTNKLALLGCQTIGDLANADPHLIHQKLSNEAAANPDLFFSQFHESCGYTINISVSIEEGYWALNLHEPDSERDHRPAQAGRTIITDIALHVLDEEYLEIGIKTTILDPINVPELPSSFRPAIVRTLLLSPHIELKQVFPIGYCEVNKINKTDDISLFDDSIRDIYMPFRP